MTDGDPAKPRSVEFRASEDEGQWVSLVEEVLGAGELLELHEVAPGRDGNPKSLRVLLTVDLTNPAIDRTTIARGARRAALDFFSLPSTQEAELLICGRPEARSLVLMGCRRILPPHPARDTQPDRTTRVDDAREASARDLVGRDALAREQQRSRALADALAQAVRWATGQSSRSLPSPAETLQWPARRPGDDQSRDEADALRVYYREACAKIDDLTHRLADALAARSEADALLETRDEDTAVTVERVARFVHAHQYGSPLREAPHPRDIARRIREGSWRVISRSEARDGLEGSGRLAEAVGLIHEDREGDGDRGDRERQDPPRVDAQK